MIVKRTLNNIYNQSKRYIQLDMFTGSYKTETPLNSYFQHYINLPVPEDKVFATYVWIDGSGINLRSKDRVLNEIPCNIDKVPIWSFDGSSTGQAKTDDSDTLLIPAAIYRDPFRKGPHIIVLCETCFGDGCPTLNNHRAHCAKVMSKIADQTPWFGIEQEYTIFDTDLWPLGWPKGRGYPVLKSKFSYCGIGQHVAGREIVECHAKASIFAGVAYGGSNAEVMKSSWEFQVGTAVGIKAADDLWVARYLLNRISEQFRVIVSYHPKPMGKDHPGIGCHHNFSVEKMRNEGGLTEIEKACNALCKNHKNLLKQYGLLDGKENKNRLCGKFETASFETCRWGVADREASVRLHRSVVNDKKGFLEDRRPAGDCDPYRVCASMVETCCI